MQGGRGLSPVQSSSLLTEVGGGGGERGHDPFPGPFGLCHMLWLLSWADAPQALLASVKGTEVGLVLSVG